MTDDLSPFERLLAADLRVRFPFWGDRRELRSVSGGLSGALVVRVRCERGTFAVKLSPLDPLRRHLAGARHEALFSVSARDATLFPRLVRDMAGYSLWRLEGDGENWQGEASEWLESQVVLTSEKLASSTVEEPAAENAPSAFHLLARFHAAARDLPLSSWTETALRSPMTLPERYVGEWEAVRPDLLESVRAALPRLEPSLREAAFAYLNRLPTKVRPTLAALASLPGSPPDLGLCLRDVHRRNIHFANGEAVAFFDWDAMRFDRRIGDFARLAASFGLSNAEAERLIDKAAAKVPGGEPLSTWERAALEPALATQVWIPPLRWLTWLLVERREFPDPAAARERFRETLELALREPLGTDET